MTLPSHRGGECYRCEGIGKLGERSHWRGRGYRGPTCDACDGTGQDYWTWYPEHTDLACSECGAEGVETMGYGEDGEEGQVCLPCYLRWHAERCGCGAWPLEVRP